MLVRSKADSPRPETKNSHLESSLCQGEHACASLWQHQAKSQRTVTFLLATIRHKSYMHHSTDTNKAGRHAPAAGAKPQKRYYLTCSGLPRKGVTSTEVSPNMPRSARPPPLRPLGHTTLVFLARPRSWAHAEKNSPRASVAFVTRPLEAFHVLVCNNSHHAGYFLPHP